MSLCFIAVSLRLRAFVPFTWGLPYYWQVVWILLLAGVCLECASRLQCKNSCKAQDSDIKRRSYATCLARKLTLRSTERGKHSSAEYLLVCKITESSESSQEYPKRMTLIRNLYWYTHRHRSRLPVSIWLLSSYSVRHATKEQLHQSQLRQAAFSHGKGTDNSAENARGTLQSSFAN